MKRVDGQQLDRGDAKRLDVVDDLLRRQSCVGAPKLLGDLRMQLGEALHVRLVDDRVLPRDGSPAGSPCQSKFGSTTTHFGMKGALSRSSKVESSPFCADRVTKHAGFHSSSPIWARA